MKKLNARTHELAAGFVAIALCLAASTSVANTLPSEKYPGGVDPSAPAASVGTEQSGGGDQGGGGYPERLMPVSVLNPGHRAAGEGEEASSSISDLMEDIVFVLYGVRIVR